MHRAAGADLVPPDPGSIDESPMTDQEGQYGTRHGHLPGRQVIGDGQHGGPRSVFVDGQVSGCRSST